MMQLKERCLLNQGYKKAIEKVGEFQKNLAKNAF